MGKEFDTFVRRLCETGSRAYIEAGMVIVRNRGGSIIWTGPGSILLKAVQDKLAMMASKQHASQGWVFTTSGANYVRHLNNTAVAAKRGNCFTPETGRLPSGNYLLPTARRLAFAD